MESKNQYLLILGSTVFYAASFLPHLSFLLLIFLVPLLILLDNNQRKLSLEWIGGMIITLVMGSVIGSIIAGQSIEFSQVLYPLGLVLILSIGIFISNLLKGSIRTIGLVGFWLGYNYLILKLIPEWSSYFTFNHLYNDDMSWTSSTGFLGIACWALISNVLISKRISFDEKSKIDSPIVLLITLVIISAPFWISSILNSSSEPIDQATMFLLYSQTEGAGEYVQSGEWVARTCASLAVLLSIYGLVRLKTTK